MAPKAPLAAADAALARKESAVPTIDVVRKDKTKSDHVAASRTVTKPAGEPASYKNLDTVKDQQISTGR